MIYYIVLKKYFNLKEKHTINNLKIKKYDYKR